MTDPSPETTAAIRRIDEELEETQKTVTAVTAIELMNEWMNK